MQRLVRLTVDQTRIHTYEHAHAHKQVVVKSSDTVNSIHIVVLAVEGIVLTLVVVIYVWAMAQKVGGYCWG